MAKTTAAICQPNACDLPGFIEVPKMYRSAYEATIDRTLSATTKLASVVNTTAAFRGGNNNTAVSYTHLDVYKRQAEKYIKKHQEAVTKLGYAYNALEHAVDSALGETVYPVSYTHLDVYKRQ